MYVTTYQEPYHTTTLLVMLMSRLSYRYILDEEQGHCLFATWRRYGQIKFFVLIEREVRPHLNLSPVPSHRPSLSPPITSMYILTVTTNYCQY